MRIPTSIYREMEDRIATKLRSCTDMADVRKIHAHIIVHSMSQSCFLATKLVSICSDNHRPDHAELIFRQVLEPNIFLLNAMIRSHILSSAHHRAIDLYRRMKEPSKADNFTYPSLLKASAALLLLDLGKQIHCRVLRSGWILVNTVGNAIMEMYAKCGKLMDARKVFDGMPERDSASWNTLIDAYARAGSMAMAMAVFDSMPVKTVVSWTALISGCVVNGNYTRAVEVFRRMQEAQVEPDDITVVSVMPACIQLGALELGRWIHGYADRTGLLSRTHVCNSLVEMYVKCGCISNSRNLFDRIDKKDVISWATMIGGYAHHGLATKAIELFTVMEECSDVRPNSVTFLAMLSACAHAGFLTEGLRLFNRMMEVYGIVPGVEHYGCLVDLLGRSGCIEEALQLVRTMPVSPDAAIWGSLLSACKTHNNVEVATIAIEHLVELEPDDAGNYVILANVYATAGRWDGVSSTRKAMRSRRMKKTPGCSSIEVGNAVREFVVDDGSQLESDEIYRILDLLSLEISRMNASGEGEINNRGEKPHQFLSQAL